MDTLTRLEKTIAQRRQADPSQSYAASLHAKGLPQIARKLGEEGVEAAVGIDQTLSSGAELDARLAYTYTDSEFKESFLSTFSQFGIVAAGDELPYLPKHIASASLSLDFEVISGGIAFKHTSKMREEPGVGSISSGVFADAQNQFDLHID